MPLAQLPGKLVVLGGGSPFTAALIDSLAASLRPLAARVLVLQGRDAHRLAAVVRYGAVRLRPLGWEVRGESEMSAALTEADTVIHQIRYGGLETRGAGEVLCSRHRVAAWRRTSPRDP